MKKNTQFLLVGLLSVSLSYSMDDKNKKTVSEPQVAGFTAGTTTTATVTVSTAAQSAKAPTISGLLGLVQATLALTELPAGVPIIKNELNVLIMQSKTALSDVHDHNEFTRTYIADVDTLVAKLMALRPEVESLFNRSSEFIAQTSTVPSAITWMESVKVTYQKAQALQAAQAKVFKEEAEKRDKEHSEFLRSLAEQQKRMEDLFTASKDTSSAAGK